MCCVVGWLVGFLVVVVFVCVCVGVLCLFFLSLLRVFVWCDCLLASCCLFAALFVRSACWIVFVVCLLALPLARLFVCLLFCVCSFEWLIGLSDLVGFIKLVCLFCVGLCG